MRIFLLSLVLLFLPFVVLAKYDPTTVLNNKFGIHILDINDLSDAKNLVNSSGGSWGYVTVVIQDDDRNFDKWQGVLNQMRRMHLIPIIRLATHIQGDAWTIPTSESIDDWVRFLDSLNWPVENRYVVLFNEPNHANEWGKLIDPEGFARFTYALAQKLHATSNDFFILPAGLDVSAASDGLSLDASIFLRRMVAAQPDYLSVLDGWTSHSYPNPGFSGSPNAFGRGTLRSYQWELNLLQELGLQKKLPIFITETGWVHNLGLAFLSNLLDSEMIGSYLESAAATVWQDPQIVAVTPFALSYQGAPFDHFSWKRLGVSEFYPQYYRYQNISKTKGRPKQHEAYNFDSPLIPSSLVIGSEYVLKTKIQNQGQGILSTEEDYQLRLENSDTIEITDSVLPTIEPGQSGEISVSIQTPNQTSESKFLLTTYHNDQKIPLQSGILRLVPPPEATIHAKLGWRTANNTSNVTVLVYDDLTLLHKFNGLSLKSGSVTVEGLRNIIPGNSYRIVILVPYYLPRQIISKLSKDMTVVHIPRLYPLDFNNDGAWSVVDIVQMFRMKPNKILPLFVGM